jgi:hypothetical protein
MPRESWHVEDSEVESCVPKTGFIREYLEYALTTTDAAAWFHLGSILTTLSVAAGGSDYYAVMPDGRFSIHGLQMWSVLVGLSGTRKSQSMDPAARVLRGADVNLIMPTDASEEALHDTLCARGGVGLMQRDELQTLFAQARRSYTQGLVGKLLESYKGGPISRDTKSGGVVSADRVRLSLLGGIPPSTLQGHTSREDWRSGFLPRFCFYGARRIRYMEFATSCAATEGRFSAWLRDHVVGRSLRLVIPYEHAKVISDWYRDHIEMRSHLVPDEVFSTLTRLQVKGLQIAALFAISRITDKLGEARDVLVEREDVLCALAVIKLFHKTTMGLFAAVGSTLEATEENAMLRWLSNHPESTVRQIADAAGMSARHVNRLLIEFNAAGVVDSVPSGTHGGSRGPKPRLYSVVGEPDDMADLLPPLPPTED